MHASKRSLYFFYQRKQNVCSAVSIGPFLLAVHCNTDLGQNYIKWIEAIYSRQTSWVQINDTCMTLLPCLMAPGRDAPYLLPPSFLF